MWEMMKKIITIILITLMLMTVATTFIGRIDEYFANNRLSARGRGKCKRFNIGIL